MPPAPISPIALPWRIRISMRIRIGISAENTCCAAPPRPTNARPRTMENARGLLKYTERNTYKLHAALSFQLLHSYFYGRPTNQPDDSTSHRTYISIRSATSSCVKMYFFSSPISLPRECSTCKACYVYNRKCSNECSMEAHCSIIPSRF